MDSLAMKRRTPYNTSVVAVASEVSKEGGVFYIEKGTAVGRTTDIIPLEATEVMLDAAWDRLSEAFRTLAQEAIICAEAAGQLGVSLETAMRAMDGCIVVGPTSTPIILSIDLPGGPTHYDPLADIERAFRSLRETPAPFGDSLRQLSNLMRPVYGHFAEEDEREKRLARMKQRGPEKRGVWWNGKRR